MSHAAATAAALQAIRARKPLIHNITNLVAMELVANCLLALGGSPAMVVAEEEVEDFVGLADALVVNTGTLTATSARAMNKAAARAGVLGRPWVLDPAGVGGTPHRTRVATELAAARPILALAGTATSPTPGVDSVHAVEDALDAARQLARTQATVVAVTGAVDHITDGERWLRVENGDPMMTRVSALGCAASAVIGAFLAVESDPLAAAAAALGSFGLAGERAAAQSAGPGNLRWQIVDQLALLDETMVRAGVRIA